MKKTLPKCHSEQEEAKFWDTHDSADYWDQMEDVTDQVVVKHPTERIVSLRIADDDLRRLKQIAYKQGLGHTTLIRSWIKEKLRELRASGSARGAKPGRRRTSPN